ncbi:hypothetical protein BC936DRAFT_140894, partial [Jimgerdemannia flammicorona]
MEEPKSKEADADGLELNINTKNNKFRDDHQTFSNAGATLYDWLGKPLPEEEKKDFELVELHWFGNAIVPIIGRDRLVMLVPTYLDDNIGWYTDNLGICLYVRKLLSDNELWQLNEILEGNCTTFHGVTQIVAVSGADGEGTKFSDERIDVDEKVDRHYWNGGQDDGENQMQVYRSPTSGAGSGKRTTGLSTTDVSTEICGSSSGGTGNSNHRNFDERTSFSDGGAGSAHTNDDNDEGGNDRELPRGAESNSVNSVNLNWQICMLVLCIFILFRWPANLILVLLWVLFFVPSTRGFENNLNSNYDEPLSAADDPQELSLPSHLRNIISEETPISGTSSFGSNDISNDGIEAAAISTATERTAAPTVYDNIERGSNSGGNIFHGPNNEGISATETSSAKEKTTATKVNIDVERGINAGGSIFNGHTELRTINYNFQSAAVPLLPEILEDPKFNIYVCTRSTTTLKGKTQEFTISFKLKIMVTESSHNFELSDVVLTGGTKHLIENQRYYFNKFSIKIIPRNGLVDFPKEHHEVEIRHWEMTQKSGTDGIHWCHKVDNPAKRAGNLRHQFGIYRTECKWECYGLEPTEYSVDLKVGLTFTTYDLRGIWSIKNDRDLINSVSIRIKNIRKHERVIIALKAPMCTWNVAKNVKLDGRGSKEMNRPESFWHSSRFPQCTDC